MSRGITLLSRTGRKIRACATPKMMTRKTHLKKDWIMYELTKVSTEQPIMVDRPPYSHRLSIQSQTVSQSQTISQSQTASVSQ